jgi:hypothetical protein
MGDIEKGVNMSALVEAKNKAVSPKTAKENIEQSKSYREGHYLSSPNLKEMLGVLLLRLVAGYSGPDGWQVFDWLLRQLYEVGTI